MVKVIEYDTGKDFVDVSVSLYFHKYLNAWKRVHRLRLISATPLPLNTRMRKRIIFTLHILLTPLNSLVGALYASYPAW